jgi:hypothetical protein
MNSRHSSRALAKRSTELAFAVPQVIAHRVMRAAMAGASPSARDRKEFHLMGAEKLAALNESWSAMMMQSFWESQKLAFSFGLSLWAPWLAAGSRQSASKQLASAARNIAGAGLSPVHRRARANVRRLSRARRRAS